MCNGPRILPPVLQKEKKKREEMDGTPITKDNDHLLTLNLRRDYSVALNKLIQVGLQLVEKHTHTSGYQIIPIDR